MLRIQSLPLYARCTRFVLVLFLVLITGLLPAVAVAASPAINLQYTGDGHDGYPNHWCATHYSVYRGDTLSRIAARFGVSVYTLAEVNRIPNINRIYPGQHLCIPAYRQVYRPNDHGWEVDYKMNGRPFGYDDYGDHNKRDDHDKYGGHDKRNDHDKDGDHAGKWTCGYPGSHPGNDKGCGDHHDKYADYAGYTPGYYDSTGGHTGICYYPDPRYAPQDAYYYGDEKAQECYQNYPQLARYP